MQNKTKLGLGGAGIAVLGVVGYLATGPKPPGVGLNPAMAGTNAHYRQIPGGAEKIASLPFNAAAGDPWHGTMWPNKFTNDLTTFQNRYGVALSDISAYVCGPSNETMGRMADALTLACQQDPARIGSTGNYDCKPYSVEVFDAVTLGPKFGNCNPGFGWATVNWADSQGGGGGGGGGGGSACPPGQFCHAVCPECPPEPICKPILPDSELMKWAKIFCEDPAWRPDGPLWRTPAVGATANQRLCGQYRRTKEWCK